LKTGIESSRQDLSSGSIRIYLGAQKRHFFRNWYATLDSQVLFFSRLFLHSLALFERKLGFEVRNKKLLGKKNKFLTFLKPKGIKKEARTM